MNLARGAFDVDHRAFTLGEVLALARIGGALDRSALQLAERLAIVARMEKSGEDIPGKALQSAVNAWRGSRHLASIDETEAWLDRNGVDLDALAEHLRRRLASEQWHSASHTDHPLAGADFGSLSRQVTQHLADEVLFSGELQDVVREAAIRAVAEPAKDTSAERQRLLQELEPRGGASGIAATFSLDQNAIPDLIRLEASYRIHRKQILAPAAMSAELHRLRRRLARIEYVSAAFDTLEAAEEALCCVRRDSKWLEPLGDSTGFPTSRHIMFVEDLEASALSALLSGARPGESFGPDKRDHLFMVFEVLDRVEPSLDDAEITSRVERQLIKRTLHPRVEERVRFRLTE